MQKRSFTSSTTFDCAFLFLIVVLSAVPYVSKLGFYSDDWYNLAVLAHTSQSGIPGEVRGLLLADESMRQRPVQALYFATAFKIFGIHAMPYHLLNIATIAAATSILYLAMLEILAERWLAFLLALVFGLAPHYCTDRFWFTMQHADLSALFAFLGTWFLCRASSPHTAQSGKGFALASVCYVLSFLSYEVMLGWIVASIGFIVMRSYRESRRADQPQRRLTGIVLLVIALLTVGLAKVSTQQRIERHHHFLSNLGTHVGDAIAQTFQFNIWVFLLKLPLDITVLLGQSTLSSLALVSAAVIALLVTAYLWQNLEAGAIPRPGGCLRLSLIGLVIFALGYALFATAPRAEFEFTSTSMDNRVAIAAAPGTACIMIALAAFTCFPIKRDIAKVRSFSILIGLICFANCLVIDGIAAYWVKAASEQADILRSLKADAPLLPFGSVVLLDGFCRYSGPGFVFEADGDTTGAVQIALRNASLKADVISADVHFDTSAVDTTYYGAPEETYAYGPRLFVYNIRSRKFINLASQNTAQAYLRSPNAQARNHCPAGRDGRGVKIF